MNTIPTLFNSNGIFFKDYTLLNDFENALIFDGRNDLNVRNFMANQAPISYLDHLDFIENLKTNSNKRYFYAYSTYALGSINLKLSDQKIPELGIFVFANMQKMGVGEKILKAFLSQIPFESVFLKVKKDNISALKLYEKCGFIQTKTEEKMIFYTFNKTAKNKKNKNL